MHRLQVLGDLEPLALPQFKWVKALLDNLHMTLAGEYHWLKYSAVRKQLLGLVRREVKPPIGSADVNSARQLRRLAMSSVCGKAHWSAGRSIWLLEFTKNQQGYLI